MVIKKKKTCLRKNPSNKSLCIIAMDSKSLLDNNDIQAHNNNNDRNQSDNVYRTGCSINNVFPEMLITI